MFGLRNVVSHIARLESWLFNCMRLLAWTSTYAHTRMRRTHTHSNERHSGTWTYRSIKTQAQSHTIRKHITHAHATQGKHTMTKGEHARQHTTDREKKQLILACLLTHAYNLGKLACRKDTCTTQARKQANTRNRTPAYILEIIRN